MDQCENCGATLRRGDPRCSRCGSPVPPPKPPPTPQTGPAPGSDSDRQLNVNVHIDAAALGNAGRRPPPTPPAHPAPAAYQAPQRPNYAPHRGGTILLLAILGWICFPVLFSLIAWIMANADLRDMRNGYKDPSGRGFVIAGKVIAILGFWLGLITIGIYAAVIASGNY